MYCKYIIQNKHHIFDKVNEMLPKDWKYINNYVLQLNDYIKASRDNSILYIFLRLYRKHENLHVFSAYMYQDCDFFNFEYDFFLVWDKLTNTYAVLQENKKRKTPIELLNNITVDVKDFHALFELVFETAPTYSEEIQSNLLDSLPDSAIIDVISKDGSYSEPHPIKAV
uniref:Uncharacterized protein n=1 Tax=Megaviridae environmental sample TaxID=1737588 RepID=A0A5J6VJE2_9VIRU|nr:MAG: hypothetical protein [Megaviridae environmental sample]